MGNSNSRKQEKLNECIADIQKTHEKLIEEYGESLKKLNTKYSEIVNDNQNISTKKIRYESFLEEIKAIENKFYEGVVVYQLKLQGLVSECNEKYGKEYLSSDAIRALLIDKKILYTSMGYRNNALSTLKNNVIREIRKLTPRKNTNFGNKRIMLKNSKITKRKY